MLVRPTSNGAVVFNAKLQFCGYFDKEQSALVLSEIPIIYCDEKWLPILLEEKVCYIRVRHLRTLETGEEICL